MISEGKIIGLLNAESPEVNAFGERDERVFSILAASTALALVNADLHKRMEKLTVEDELTGLYNFRYFRARLEDEKRRAVRYGQPLSLIMVDIDWFKQLNDCFGHEIGNSALRRLGTVIESCVRDVDILARYGGEEFMIILPQTGGAEAFTIGERIRRAVEETDFSPEPNGRPIRLTVSVGVSCFPENGLPEENLVEAVDRALYQAKGSGKNTVWLTDRVTA
jgi:diguanylate cyclase (GGDEF)-like protein